MLMNFQNLELEIQGQVANNGNQADVLLLASLNAI